MSESTATSAPVNPNPAPEPQLPTGGATAAPAETAPPSAEVAAPAPAVQESAEQAAGQAAEREQEARDQADATRAAAVKAYRRGESAYAAGLLESGRLCGVYVGQRLALGDKREVAVKALEGDLSRFSSTEVDVNRLVRTYHAYRLLAEEPGLTAKPAKGKPAPADGVAYGVYRDHWCRLVERAAGTREESYTLLPGVEKACLAMFRRAVRDELSPKAAGELCGRLVRAHAARLARAEKARLAQAEARAKAERQAEQRAVADLRQAQQAAEKAKAEAKAKQDQATAEAAARAAADLEAKQRAVVEQQAKAEQAERERQRAEKAAKEQAERDRKAAEKAAAKAEAANKPATVTPPAGEAPKAPNPADQRGEVKGNLLRMAEAGTVKDVAGMVVELITGTGKAEAVLEEVLRQLKAGGHVHKRAVGAIDAALLVLSRKEAPKPPAGPSPADVASRLPLPAGPEVLNGQPMAGAA
jgi:hypothetical protein